VPSKVAASMGQCAVPIAAQNINFMLPSRIEVYRLDSKGSWEHVTTIGRALT